MSFGTEKEIGSWGCVGVVGQEICVRAGVGQRGIGRGRRWREGFACGQRAWSIVDSGRSATVGRALLHFIDVIRATTEARSRDFCRNYGKLTGAAPFAAGFRHDFVDPTVYSLCKHLEAIQMRRKPDYSLLRLAVQIHQNITTAILLLQLVVFTARSAMIEILPLAESASNELTLAF